MRASGLLAGSLNSVISAAAVSLHARSLMWSVEREPQEYKSVDEIIDDAKIQRLLEETKEAAKDTSRVRAILEAAKDRSFLKNAEPGRHAHTLRASSNLSCGHRPSPTIYS